MGRCNTCISSWDRFSGSATLRRNTHRIEKGLINRKPKAVFAEDYIGQTVSIYGSMRESGQEPETVRWAHDVLTAYFARVKSTPIIDKARTDFERWDSRLAGENEATDQRIPYQRLNGVKSGVDYEDFLNLSKQRRSVRYYRPERVPMDLVRKAIEAATFSPSACNRQPFRFIIIDDPESLKQVNRLPMGTDTFADNMQMLVLLVGDLSAYFDERDRHVIYIDGGLAAMSFMLALETLGLSSCPINWPDIEERERLLARRLGLSPSDRCIMFISVGYALEEGLIPYSQKKSFENLAVVNPHVHPD